MNKSEPNFKCPETGKEFYINEYKTTFSNGGKVYKDKWNKVLVNPDNGVPLVDIPKEVDWSDGIAPQVIAGSGKAGTQKRVEQLQKRSHKHYKKEIAEEKSRSLYFLSAFS